MVEALASCSSVQLNAVDEESGWTPLMAALYAGNLRAAVALQRVCDTLDASVVVAKSFVGETALDLAMATMSRPQGDTSAKTPVGVSSVTSSRQTSRSASPVQHEVIQVECTRSPTSTFTWGSNSNYVLGHDDADNKVGPERLPLDFVDGWNVASQIVDQHDVVKAVFSKYHFALLTLGPQGNNLLLAGFGATLLAFAI
jgi:hypothetical protein